MKKHLLILITIAIIGLGGLSAQPMTGTYTVGPSGDYTSITAAITSLNSNGFSGSGPVVFELMADYLSSGETFPITFPSTLPTTVDNTLILRPAADAIALSISHSAGITMQLNGADYVTIDGRPGGTGVTPELTISNTLVAGSATAGVALQLINGALNNTIQYCNFTGVSTSTSGAVVSIYTSTAVTGNNNNLIDHCNIHDGATKPLVLFVSAGTTSKANTGNIVSNNNFYNWQMGASANGVAMTIGANNTDMVVTGNSFYQTFPTTSISQNSNGFVNIGGANGTSFTNNYLGGSAPLCAGTPMSLTYQTYYGVVRGINLSPGALSPTSIQGNTIQNIEVIVPVGQGGNFTAINQGSGVVNIGTITPNIIGSTSVPNSITVVNNSTSSASLIGITASGASFSTDQTNISNNVISGLSMTNTGTGGVNFTGIGVSSWYTLNVYVTGNTIGSTTMADAITNSTPGTITGITASSRNNSILTGNTIANLTSSNTAATGNQILGINAAGGTSTVGTITVDDNTIFNLSSSSSSTGTAGSSSLIGISVSGTTGSRSVKGNTIYGLSNQNATAAVHIIGLSYSGTTSVNSPVAGNFINSLNLASSETASSITGIYALNGNTSYYNNMVRLGIDAAGTGISTGYAINGILDAATTAAANTNSFYHNTLYIGGNDVTGITSNTFAFNSSVLSNVTNIRNNILVNARSGGSAGKHYAIAVGGTVPAPAGLTSSHNIFYVPGTIGGILGLFNATDQPALTDWQNATAQDVLSAQTDPMLMLPAGSSTTVNLHVQASNPIEGSGVPIAAITGDFDGDVRSSSTPVDIGADAGNFTNSGDLFPPNIAFTPLLNTGSTISPELSVEITDGVAVSSGANQPRIYFKKATDANAFAGNTSADNGWKYTFATNTASTYTFLIDYSILNGGMVLPGDVVQYFVVAQDDAANFASLGAGATSSSAINPIQNINGAPSVAMLNSYLIINNNISGTFTVPGNYATLTGAGGLFEAINIGTVTGNFTVQITDNLTEPGTFGLNQFAAPYTMTIVPASASLKTITGDVNDGLIRFNGADNVMIDGRFEGAGNWLEFYNTSTGAASTNCAMLFTNGATYNTVKYSTIKAQSASGPVIYFYAIGTNTGNNSFNTIDHCNIDGSAAKPQGVYSYYNTSGGEHVSNTISNNNIYDFTANGISLSYGVSSWTISGNSFYQTQPRVQSADINVIIIVVGANHLISGNYIGGSAPMAGGLPWTITGNGGYFRAMYLYNTMTNFVAENNTITNININTTSSGNGFYGFSLSPSGNGTVSGNTIGSTTIADAIVINRSVSSTDYGIYKIGTTSTISMTGNSIGGFTLSSSATTLSHSFQAIYYTGPPTAINDNIIGSLTVPNSIHLSTPSTSTAAQSIYGINTSYTAGSCSVSGNTIANITNNYLGTNASGLVRGISTLGAGNVTINGNTIHNLSCAAPINGVNNAAVVIGIADNATGAAKVISNNMVTGLTSTAASPVARVTGIYAGAGTGTYYNNVVNLGSGITLGIAFTGIQIGVGTSPVYFNTVNLTGVVDGTSLATHAFYSVPTGTRNYRNNNFVNTRSGGTTGTHYAIRVAGTTSGQVGLTLDYNNYFVSGPALGFFNNLDVADLAAWKLAVGYDVNSLSVDPLFTSPANLQPLEAALNSGIPIAGITLDYTGTLRNAVTPTMGAYEMYCANPENGGVIAADITNGCDPFDPALITSTSVPTITSGTLEFKWQQSTTDGGSGFTDIDNSNSETYDPGVLNVNTWFKRLVRVDCKGIWDGAPESNVIGFTVTSQPVSVTITESINSVCNGTEVAFTAAPVNGGDLPTYQWYKNGAPVSTADSYTYIPQNNDQVYLELTSNLQPCGTGVTATSNTITMTVNPISNVSVMIFPSDNNVCIGTVVSFAAVAMGDIAGSTLNYQWWVNDIPVGTNSNVYAYSPANGDDVKCELSTDLICPSANPATSNIVEMVVNSPLVASVTIAPDANPVNAGTLVTFTAFPENGGASPTITWYKNSVSDGTGLTYSFVPVQGDAVYAIMTADPTLSCVSGSPATSATVTMTVNDITKVLNITAVMLEGLYNGTNMNQAFNDLGPQWPAGIADHVTVELHSSSTYSTIEYSVADVALSTSGTMSIQIPAIYSGNYYVTIKHRNSIETTTAIPVVFSGSVINLDFDDQSDVFGGNMKNINGTYVIYSGDVSLDGAIDSGDMSMVFNLAISAASGYLPEDVNGDGAIDSFDMSVVFNNATQAIGAITP